MKVRRIITLLQHVKKTKAKPKGQKQKNSNNYRSKKAKYTKQILFMSFIWAVLLFV